jgi:ABC-type Fe3+ transport system substrate-binding protein
MSDGLAVVFTTQARAEFARRVLGVACPATGVAARLEVFGSSGSLYARISGRREGPRGDVVVGLGPYLAHAAAGQRLLEAFQPPRAADGIPHQAEWRWTALDASAWVVSPGVQRLDDLLDVPRLGLVDPARSEVGLMGVLASLDRFRQAEGDAERAWLWWQRRVRSGVMLAEDQTALVQAGSTAGHLLGLGSLDGGAPLAGLAPLPNAVGLLTGSRNADAARRVLGWLLSADAADTISSAGGLSWWQAASNGLSALSQGAPPLDVDWTFQQYRAARERWLEQGFSPAAR